MKKQIGIALSLMMSLALLSGNLKSVNAEDDNQDVSYLSEGTRKIVEKGNTGSNSKYVLYNNGDLVISGTGIIDTHFGGINDKRNIVNLIIEDGITDLG